MKRTITPATAVLAALLVSLAACEAKKSSNPLSPSVAGPIPGVEITPPVLLEPRQGFRLREAQQPVDLLIENASTTGVRPLYYTFEVASDRGFATKVFARGNVAPGEGGRTKVRIDRLDLGRIYYWRARAEDGANTGTFATSHFEVLPRPQLGAPTARSPVNNEQVATLRPAFRIGNADRNSAVGRLRYDFQVARDQTFAQIVAAANIEESAAETIFTPATDLAPALPHFWRARGTDGETTGPWMVTQTFRTPGAAAPGPGPSPPPGAACGPPYPNTHLGIVECQRSKYGHMSEAQLVSFLRAVARDLNSGGLSGGPFGLLVKTSGNQCHGYSCDILCAGNGGSQRQYDVLVDIEGSQGATWHQIEPGRMVVRPCEIQ